MKKLLLALLATSFSLLCLNGQDVSFNFGDLTLGNSSGTGTQDMPVAIVVDTSGGSTFNFGSYDPFDYTISGQYLSVGGQPTDDWYVFGSAGITLTGAAAIPVYPNAGLVGNISNVSYTNLTANDSFAVIWFPSASSIAGSSYGGYMNAEFLLPGVGGGFTSTTLPSAVQTASYTFAAVPEPSTYAAIFGALALGFVAYRRRRS